MNTVIAIAILLLASLLTVGCGGEEPPLQTLPLGSSAQPTVRLMHAVASTWCPPKASCYGNNRAYARGYIEVADLAYHKQVVVHYNVRQTSQWKDVAAKYVGSSGANREIWSFETPKVSYPPRLSGDFQFAIRYTVAGKTYWDNNGGRNYMVGDGPRPIWPRVALNGSNLALNWAETQGNNLRGDIVLKDLAYHKQVKVVYSADNWQSVKTANAGYFNSFCGAMECGSTKKLQSWGFNITPPSGAKQIKFAISYTIKGDTFWDNNFKRDYTLNVPGKINRP